MKYRDYKTFVPGVYYHIYSRGVDKNNIFQDDGDYEFFLHRLKENLLPELSRGTPLYPGDQFFNKKRKNFPRKLLEPGLFELVAYCLMPNHFHFIFIQNKEVPLSELLLKLCTSYSMYFNQKYGRVGALFQDAFKAIPIEENDYLFWLSIYVHQNPVKAGLVDSPEKWFWSSCLDFTGDREGLLCNKGIILEQLKHSKNYSSLLKKEPEQQVGFPYLSTDE